MSTEEKQEGEFKVKKPKTKQLVKKDEVIKVDLAAVKEEEPIKVDLAIPKEEEVSEEEVQVIQEITDEDEQDEPNEVLIEASDNYKEEIARSSLPENIEKLVSFMEETGGTVEDYVRLNADYSQVDTKVLLKEYYKKSKPYLDESEVNLLLEDNFEYDEDLDDDRDIRRKKLAYKEEVEKAKSFLEQTKSKYYDEIKLRPGITQEQKKATEFFNRHTEEQIIRGEQHEKFKSQTKQVFTDEFKGFDFDLGEKKFRYGIQNPSHIVDTQSDIQKIIGKFLDKDGNVKDTKSYHKAMYTAVNADKIASHFYEQGKADATKEIVSTSKNPSTGEARKALGDVFVNGLKVKSISGADSSKLKIKTRKFN
tara:strand:- start:6893 stop:7987 length:1095 start_codon:yes stop_codon:yes gene_type:complete